MRAETAPEEYSDKAKRNAKGRLRRGYSAERKRVLTEESTVNKAGIVKIEGNMDREKLKRIYKKMEERNLPQMIITDPPAIFYLTGKWIHPGERMLALYISTKGKERFFVNRLFPIEEDLGVEIQYFDDTEDSVELLSQVVDKESPLGVDKTWSARFLLRLQELKAASSYVNGSVIVDKVRQIKDKDEQEKLIQSSLLNDAVMAELIPYVVKGHTEKELNAIARELYKKHGASDVSFDPITAYGRGAADPHHETDDTKGKRGDCVLLDIGGVLNNYISDMTRTVFLGEVSERHKEIYQIVRDANLRGIAMAKPGNRMCDVDLACRNYIEEKGFGKYFTHRTGHSAGIEDHEVGDVSSVNEEIIEVGQCFSVEPGIYIPEENIGVRVEDLVLITEDGCMVLNHYPKDLLIVKEDGTTEVAE